MWDNDKDGSHGTTGSSPQSSPPIDMSHLNDLKWSGSSRCSPVVQQRAEPPCDVIDAPLPQPSGGALALLDGMYTELSHRHGRTQQLLLYTRRHHLLLLSRQVVVHQMNLMSYMTYVCELLQQRPPVPSLLCTACLRLRELTSHSAVLCRRYRGDPFLHPTPARNMPAALLLMAVKAAILTERFILRVLHRVAQVPAEVPAGLCRALTSYNQVVADLSKHTSPPAALRPFCLSRTLGILAEERGRVMAGEVCRVWTQCRRDVETNVNRPTDPPPKKSHVLQGQRSPSSPEVIVQVTPVLQQNRVVPCQGSPSSLGVLVQEDRSQVNPLLQILAGLDMKMWKQGAALYSQYCARLWPATYSCVFHALCPGMRGPGELPALPSLPEGVCASSVRILQDMLTSDDVPEPCASLGRSLCQSFLCVRSLIAWDSTLCRALSSILTDKCAASTLGSGDPVSANHSRTCAILVTLCQHLTGLLLTPTVSHQSREGRSLAERPFSPPSYAQQGVLSRCTLSLHLCDMWLQSRTQIFLTSGSLSQLVLITHGDLPVLTEQCRSLVAAMENVDWLPSTQRLSMKIERSRDVLEGLVVSLPHVLSSVCSRRAQDVFQHMMPARRPWRGKMVAGPDLAPSEFAQVAVSAVVVPVLEGARPLCLEEQVSAVCAAVSVFMEAWMAHILREKIKFSLQGALQLRRDFESVRDVLRSSESRLSPEVVRAALALQVFTQADNAIICLLQQPSRKTYLQAGGCAVFPCCPPLCRVAVDTMSDSLQSLDSLERRVWDGDVPGRVPRHSHDSYLPHNQRQWLSLRVHKSWNGLSLPWEGQVVSEG